MVCLVPWLRGRRYYSFTKCMVAVILGHSGWIIVEPRVMKPSTNNKKLDISYLVIVYRYLNLLSLFKARCNESTLTYACFFFQSGFYSRLVSNKVLPNRTTSHVYNAAWLSGLSFMCTSGEMDVGIWWFILELTTMSEVLNASITTLLFYLKFQVHLCNKIIPKKAT